MPPLRGGIYTRVLTKETIYLPLGCLQGGEHALGRRYWTVLPPTDGVHTFFDKEKRCRVLLGDNPGENLKPISRRCHTILVAFVWELTKETIELPLG